MDIQTQIEMLTCSDNKQAYKALKELVAICEKSNEVYPYFDQFVEMMNHEDNSFIRTRGLKLIAYCSQWDNDNKVNEVIHSYLEHMEDDKPITARQCIQDSVVIAKYKPELIDTILKELDKMNKIYDESMQKLIYKDRQKAIRQIRQYTW